MKVKQLSFIGIYRKYFMKLNKCKDEKFIYRAMACPNPECFEIEDVKVYKVFKCTYQIHCGGCGMKGPVSGDKEGATKYWNNLLRKN